MAREPEGFTDLDTAHLLCRTLGHAWDPVGAPTHVSLDRRKGWEVEFSCLRSGCKRTDVWSTNGVDLLSRSYELPGGYLITDPQSWGGRQTFNANARRTVYDRLSRGARRPRLRSVA